MTPPRVAGDLPVHPHGRKATWFELFFDLVFVVAVAQLAGSFSHHYDWVGAAVFAFGFLSMWWCWLGHTFFATRFDEDTPQQRWLGLAQILTVVWMAYGVSDYNGERAWVFASGLAAFKLLLALAYALCWRWRGARGLILSYATLYLAQAFLWAASVVMPPDVRWVLWGFAFALDLVSPWLVARHTHQVPPHPEHLPERFGLFTIILLGEGMAATIHALDHSATLTAHGLSAAVGGALLTFMVWMGYFDRTRAHQEREVNDPGAGRNLRLWAYAHVALYLGVASLAAGTVYLATQITVGSNAQWLFAGGATLVMIGLSLLGVAAAAPNTWWRQALPHFVVAAVFVAMVGTFEFVSAMYLYLASAGFFVVQLSVPRAKMAWEQKYSQER